MIEHPQAAILRALADGDKQFQWCETNGTSAWTDIDSAYVLDYLGNPAYRVRVKKAVDVDAQRQRITELEKVLDVALETLLSLAKKAELLKKDCGGDPESPQAIRNGRYMHLSYMARDAITKLKEVRHEQSM